MNEKITCNVIKDLIPLYKENLCSPESCSLIEMHIGGCKCCRDFAENYMEEKVKGLVNSGEQEPFRNVNRKLKRYHRIVIILTALLGTIILCMLYFATSQ